MTKNPKGKIRSLKHKKFIRSHNSLVPGYGETISHHISFAPGNGMGTKPCDRYCVPLKFFEHRKLHDMGERSYWKSHGKTPEDLMAIAWKLASQSPDEEIRKLTYEV